MVQLFFGRYNDDEGARDDSIPVAFPSRRAARSRLHRSASLCRITAAAATPFDFFVSGALHQVYPPLVLWRCSAMTFADPAAPGSWLPCLTPG